MAIKSKKIINDALGHHAYGIVGVSAKISDLLLEDLVSFGIVEKGNPDFFRQRFEVLAVDDSRRIRDIHESKPFSADIPRVFILEIHGATREAQNALLKILEEPRENNFFFIIMPSADILLPTVRSRLYMVHHVYQEVAAGGAGAAMAENGRVSGLGSPADFIKMPLSKKIAFADELAAQVSDEKATKYEAIMFLNSLEKSLHDSVRNSALNSARNHAEMSLAKFEAIAHARDYMNDRAPSVKMLLEYVALSV